MIRVAFINNIHHPVCTWLINELHKSKKYKIDYFIVSEEDKGNWEYEERPDVPTRTSSSVTDIIKINPDIIVIAGWDLPIYILSFLYAKLFRKKIILWFGSTMYEKSLLRVPSLPLVKSIVRNVDGIVTYGTRSFEYIRYLGADREKIFKGIYTCNTDYYNSKRKQKSQTEKTVNFLYVGQLIKRKGLDILLKAFKSHSKKASLKIVGDGPILNSLTEMVNTMGIANVLFAGVRTIKELPEIYSSADVFILPSRQEVWGLVVNEAMSASLPVIVSRNAGSSADLVKEGKNGFTFDPDQPEELSKLIKYFIDRPQEIEKMGQESRKIVKKYSISNLVDSFSLAFRYSLRI